MRRFTFAWLALWMATWVFPGELSLSDQSVFAVITHKGGVLKGMAHNHFVYAGDFLAQLSTNPEALEESRFEITVPIEELVIDEAEKSAQWYPRIEALAILDEPFSEQSASNLKKIRKAMLSGGQLNAKKHKEIKAKLIEVKPQQTIVGGVSFAYALRVEVTIHDKTQTADFPANLNMADGQFSAEAVGRFKFTDFGIKPYSAMLGAVSNQDEFHIYVNLQAE